MSSVAGAAGGSAQALRAAAPFAPIAPPPTAAAPRPTPAAAPPPQPQPYNPPRAAPPEDALRPRLRLTPTATDEEFRTVFDSPPPAAPADEPPMSGGYDSGSWTWKDLLGGLSRNPAVQSPPPQQPQEASGAASPDQASADYLNGQIAFMGIDPSALLPRARIEEIAAAVQTGDVDGAREVVKRLAPAAIRRLVRKLFSDNALREETERFLARYGALVAEAAQQDRQGFLIVTLLGSESGRTYLLLDAAVGDLA